MQGFLLDSHIPSDVVHAVRRLSPDCVVDHLASWNDGILLHAPDEQILSAALAHDFALVTYDVSTIPAILHRWIGSDRHVPRVVLVSAGTLSPRDVGSLSRGLIHLCHHPEYFDPTYPVVYLQRFQE